MRGRKKDQLSMLSLATPEQMVPAEHPLRRVKVLAEAALVELEETFSQMYSENGRPSVPPERLLKATLLMALYGLRSERMFCEQLGYNLLFKWFLDMELADEPFDPTTFGKNRKRMMESEVATRFFAAVVEQARKKNLLSSEHFSADGTLLESYASMKSFRPKDDDDDDGDSNRWSNFRGTKRRNETHASKTDPDARLVRKGRGTTSKLAYVANALMENRNGILVGFDVAIADGYAEREGALELLRSARPGNRRVTLGADKAYDTRGFVESCRQLNVVPHVAQNVTNRRSSIDSRTTRHAGYGVSQKVRRRIEQVFGWLKSAANLRKSRYRGRAKTALYATLAAASYNLLRIARIGAIQAQT